MKESNIEIQGHRMYYQDLVIKLEAQLIKIKSCCIKEHNMWEILIEGPKIINISCIKIIMIICD